jgi:hypothetical protein
MSSSGPYPAGLTFWRPADQDMVVGETYLLDDVKGHRWCVYEGRSHILRDYVFRDLETGDRSVVMAAGSMGCARVPPYCIPDRWR